VADRKLGYRPITVLLKREGWVVNHKRVERLRRTDNLLCLRKPAFRPATTDSRHAFALYPNLAWKLRPTSVNLLWVADITYVRLAEAFVYLAVILDAYSRRVVGWGVADHLRSNWRWRRWRWRWRHARWCPVRWCITPTVACSMRAATTSRGWRRRGSSPA
jgi:hypothetical protein